MLDLLTDSRFGIWIVAAAIILIDSALLLAPGKFAYRVRTTKRVSASVAVPSHIFALRNKNLLLSVLAFPCTIFHVSDISAPIQTPAQLHRTMARVQRLQRNYASLSLSSALVLALVAAGPLIAILHSQALAFLSVAVVLYPTSIVIGYIIYSRRHLFRLGRLEAFLLAFEFALCPILIVNVGKKLANHQSPNVNTRQMVDTFCSNAPSVSQAINDNLAFFGLRGEGTVA
jgi:hypothetical protein